MVKPNKYKNLRQLTACLFILAGLLNVPIVAATPKNLYETCEPRTMICSTEFDFINYNCQLGETIKLPDECNTAAELHCLNEICVPNCIPANLLAYDYTRKECVSRVGQRCNERRRCQKPAVCEYDNIRSRVTKSCKCPRGTENVNSTCIQLVVYNKECGSESVPLPQRNCDYHQASIVCVDGVCKCAVDDQTFHPEYNRCLSHLGQHCSDGDDSFYPVCIPNAACTGYYSLGHCVCMQNTAMSENKQFCLSQTWGGKCDLKDPFLQCDPSVGLECVENLCKCKAGTNRNLNKCQIKAGNSCNEAVSEQAALSNGKATSESEFCVPDSVCVDGKCLCKNGFSPKNNGLCSLSFGQLCQHTRALFECNSDHGLACVNGKCACNDIHFDYNPISLKCEDSFEMTLTDLTTVTSITGTDPQKNSNPKSGNLVLLMTVMFLVILVILAIVLFRNYIMDVVKKIKC